MGSVGGLWEMDRVLLRYISIVPQGQPASVVGPRTFLRDHCGSHVNPSLEGRADSGVSNRLVRRPAEMPLPAILRGRPGSRNRGPDWCDWTGSSPVTGKVNRFTLTN